MLRFVSLSVLVIGLACFTGCEKKKKPGSSGGRFPPVVDAAIEAVGGKVDPIADPAATKGGMFTMWGGGYPKSINYWVDPTVESFIISGLLFESLGTLDPVTDDYIGILAESWEASDDGLEFTFKIQPSAVWSDGQPVTAGDVKFFYDTIMDPENLTSLARVEIGRFETPEVIDEKTIRVKAKTPHWQNLYYALSSLYAMPEHSIKGKDFNKLDEFDVVSGPYVFHDRQVNSYMILKRRGDWWGRVLKGNQHIYNFDYLRWRYIEDRNVALESLKKGDIDYFPIYTSAIWAEKTQFPSVQKNWVVRQEVYNKQPLGFQGFVMNTRRELFKDRRVREAMSHLLNRKQINEKLMYNAYFLLNSYYGDLFPENVNPDAPMYAYDPEKARALLSEAGWEPNDEGILEKEGALFEFNFMQAGPLLPHLDIFVEDLKKVGIRASIEQVDYATRQERSQNHQFDMYWQSFSGGRVSDPERLWLGALADKKASYNIAGIQSAAVDALIEEQKTEFDLGKRKDILRKLDNELTSFIPYVLLWTKDNERLLYWNKFGTPKAPLGKYGLYHYAMIYWWLDPDKEKALEDAKKSDSELPASPAEVRYSE